MNKSDVLAIKDFKKYAIRQVGNQIGLYDKTNGKWLKWLGKQEQNYLILNGTDYCINKKI